MDIKICKKCCLSAAAVDWLVTPFSDGPRPLHDCTHVMKYHIRKCFFIVSNSSFYRENNDVIFRAKTNANASESCSWQRKTYLLHGSEITIIFHLRRCFSVSAVKRALKNISWNKIFKKITIKIGFWTTFLRKALGEETKS